MHAPILPFERPSLRLERDTFGLGDVDGFEIGSEFFLQSFGVVVGGRRSVQRSSDFWDIDVDDLLRVGVVDAVAILVSLH